MTRRPIDIESITIDDTGRLLVRPCGPETFEFIYRAACGVGWDANTRSLVTPIPEESSYFDWFTQIIGAVTSEYGEALTTTPSTCWHNVPDELRDQINGWLQNPRASGDSTLGNDIDELRSRLQLEEDDRAAILKSEVAFRAKDWALVVRLLEPLKGRHVGAPAARLAYARKQTKESA